MKDGKDDDDAIKCKKLVKRRLNHADETPIEVNSKKSAKMAAASTEVCDHHFLDDTIEDVDDERAVQSPVMVPVLTRCASTPQDGQTLQNYVSPPNNNALLADSGFESSAELSSGSLSSDRSTSGQGRVSLNFDEGKLFD